MPFYELVSYGAAPVTLETMKAYLRMGKATAEDTLIQVQIDTATTWSENYAGRSFRANTWKLFIDCFSDRITINKTPLGSITQVSHIVSGSTVVVDADVYYIKNLSRTVEILLAEGKDWPTDTDDREQAITIEFVTKAYCAAANAVGQTILKLTTNLYENRGDCGYQSAKESGIFELLGPFRIARI